MDFKYAEEMKIVGSYPRINAMPASPKYNTPISPRENYLRFMRGEKAMWMPMSTDYYIFNPNIIPDNVARGLVMEKNYDEKKPGGDDWFGVNWIFIPEQGGSMVRPGAPKVADISAWEDYITFPDLDQLDWEGCAERNRETLENDGRLRVTTFFTGFFERLISFVDFEEAAISVIDEDVQEDVHRLFDRLADFYCDLIRRMKKYFKIDQIWFHDDWGSQRAPFFSTDTLCEMVLPYIKRVVDCAHENEVIFDLHSCGFIEPHIPAIIETGVDTWVGQPLNDKKKLVDTYGDKFTFGVEITVPTDESEALAFAKKTMEDYGDKRVILRMNRAANPKCAEIFRNYVYDYTRTKYAE